MANGNRPTPMDNLNKLLNKTNPEKRMWVNRDFVFGDNYINNKDFNSAVVDFYKNTENAEKLFEKITKFSDLEYSPNDFKVYENMFDTYKKATGQTTKEVQQQIINQFKDWKVSPEETQKHFRLIKDAAKEVGWQGSYEHLDYSSFNSNNVNTIPKIESNTGSTPVYENPNGRRRRKGYSTELRNKIIETKEYYNNNSPDFKFNTVEHMSFRIGAHDVEAPWSDGSNFRSGLGEGRTSVDYGYDKKEIQEFIQETARVAKEDYGLDNINVNTVYGLDDALDGTEGQFSWNSYNVNNNHIDIYTDTIWKRTALDENGNLLEDGVERFKERIKYTIGHEMRHQWQHTTEEGKAIEEADDLYKQTKINDYTDDYDKYYHEPVEVDARYNGEKFRRTYDLKAKKYKEKLEKQGFNKEFRDKMDEINLRPKNRIIGHQFEKKPIDISSYRKFDNVEPIDWDIDTGNKSPINKHDVSKNTRYRNAKLNKGQKSLRPTVTMNGNNVEIDSIYNHSVPKKLQPKVEPYNPKIGDNFINNETGERYVLNDIGKADPDLGINNDTYYYSSPNGERLTRQRPIVPNDIYSLSTEDVLSPDDVRRIDNSFNDLRTYTDSLEEAKLRLSSLQNDFNNGADNLDEIYNTTKSVRSLEAKVAQARRQIDYDDNTFNSNGRYSYNINEKTKSYMDKADELLGPDYSETKYVIDYDEAFKKHMPRNIINTIDAGFDNAIHIPNNTSVKNNIKDSAKRVRGKKKGQATGRGNRKKIVRNTGRVNKNTIKNGPRKAPKLKRRGKSTLKAVGRNGKTLNNIPRVKIPLSKKDIVKTAANLIINETATNTASTIIQNIEDVADDIPTGNNIPNKFNIPDGYSDDPISWTDEDIMDMSNGDQDIYNELKKRRDEAYANDASDPSSSSGDSGNGSSNQQPESTPTPEPEPPEPTSFSKDFDPNDPSTWTDADKARMNSPTSWTDDDIRRLADGDADYFEELLERRNSYGSGPKMGPDDIRFHTDDAPIPNNYHIDTPNTDIIEGFDDVDINAGKLGVVDKVMTGVNILGAIGDYKTARREGHGVVSSAVRAGGKFAIDEALGVWAFPIALVKTVPGLAIKGADMLYKENRRMNSAANFQTFGDAQFMDTQQLATMRQSGMEMAKMSQYNLQQTLMGNEATYLHR